MRTTIPGLDPSISPPAVSPAPSDGGGGRRQRVGPLPAWRLHRVQALVEARFAEPLTLADMAAAAGVSRMHFAAQFRVATGLRPHDYLLVWRVVCAMAQMLAGDAPLAHLALGVGFQSQSHFSTVFKRLTGTTPATWRRGQRRTGRSGPGLSGFSPALTPTGWRSCPAWLHPQAQPSAGERTARRVRTPGPAQVGG